MGISQADLFKRLGAALLNARWSWGSVRASDGVVFLGVWQDRMTKHDGKLFFMVTHHEKYLGREDDLGYKERLEHVERLRSGALCYMVMCLAADVDAVPRKIKSFDRKDLFVGGQLLELNGDTWVEMKGRVPFSVAMEKND